MPTFIPVGIDAVEVSEQRIRLPDKMLYLFNITDATPAYKRSVEQSRLFCRSTRMNVSDDSGEEVPLELVKIESQSETDAIRGMGVVGSLGSGNTHAWIAQSPAVGQPWEWGDGTQFAERDGTPIGNGTYTNWIFKTDIYQNPVKLCARTGWMMGWVVDHCDSLVQELTQYVLCERRLSESESLLDHRPNDTNTNQTDDENASVFTAAPNQSLDIAEISDDAVADEITTNPNQQEGDARMVVDAGGSTVIIGCSVAAAVLCSAFIVVATFCVAQRRQQRQRQCRQTEGSSLSKTDAASSPTTLTDLGDADDDGEEESDDGEEDVNNNAPQHLFFYPDHPAAEEPPSQDNFLDLLSDEQDQTFSDI